MSIQRFCNSRRHGGMSSRSATLRALLVASLFWVPVQASSAQSARADSVLSRVDSIERARQASENCDWANRALRTLTPAGRVGSGAGNGAALSASEVHVALGVLVTCGAEGGRTAAMMARTLRASTDTAILKTFVGMLANFRDAAVLDAALEIARDRTASIPARVYAFRTLFVLRSGKTWAGYRSMLREDATADSTLAGLIAPCGEEFQIADAAPFWYEGAPLPADFRQRVTALTEQVVRDRTEPVRVRSASTCAMND